MINGEEHHTMVVDRMLQRSVMNRRKATEGEDWGGLWTQNQHKWQRADNVVFLPIRNG